MHSRDQGHAGFKRQIVFRIGAADWPLLQAAATEHGSIQAAVLAGIRALNRPQPTPDAPHAAEPGKAATKRKPQRVAQRTPAKRTPTPAVATAALDPHEEIRAREAAQLLGLKTGTVSGYIRSGRLPGRYSGTPTWHDWVTTRGAVDAYRARRG